MSESTCERCGATYFRSCVNCEPQLRLLDDEVEELVQDMAASWADDFERALRWLCAPEPTVTIPLKEYERLKAGYGIGALEQQMRLHLTQGTGLLGGRGQLYK